MKKYGKWIFILIAILAVAGIVIYLIFFQPNNTNRNFSNASRMSMDNQAENLQINNEISR